MSNINTIQHNVLCKKRGFNWFHSHSQLYIKITSFIQTSVSSEIQRVPIFTTKLKMKILTVHCCQNGIVCIFCTKRMLHFSSRASCLAYKLCSVSKTVQTFISFLNCILLCFFSSKLYVPVFISVVYIVHVWNKCYHAWSKLPSDHTAYEDVFVDRDRQK